MNVLRAVVVHPTLRHSEVAQQAADYLLYCWEHRADPFRPVGFGIGSTWDIVQYPFVQYQLLKTVDTLSQVPMIRTDPRFQEMLGRLKSKQDAEGRLMPESVNKSWSDFDFGQKKSASPWVTFLTVRAIVRADQPD